MARRKQGIGLEGLALLGALAYAGYKTWRQEPILPGLPVIPLSGLTGGAAPSGDNAYRGIPFAPPPGGAGITPE